MKTFFVLMLSLLLMSFAPAETEPVKLTLPMILAFIVGMWEVVIRIIPTAGHWGVVGKIIEILAWISNFLNRKK